MPEPSRAAVLIFTRGPAAEGARKRLQHRGGADLLGTVFETVLAEASACRAGVIVAAPEGARLPALPPAAGRIRQEGSGSADRLERAIADGFARGVERLVVIGDDAPEIRSDDLEMALQATSRPVPTAVVGPCRDGGFYLLALNRPAPEALRGIPWGSRRTLAELRRRLRAGGFELLTLRTLADVDDRAGVQRFGARTLRHARPRLRALGARIAAWVRAVCAWAAPLTARLPRQLVAHLLPSRAPPSPAQSL